MYNLLLNALVPYEKNGQRLDQVLAYLFPQYSRAYLQKQISNQNVWVNSRCYQKRSLTVFQGQHIQMRPMLETIQTIWKPDKSIPLKVVYEDEALIIVNKAAGIVTHPSEGHPDKTLVNALLNHAPCLAKLPRSGIIHRLDKDTSGLLVIPKTLLAHAYLTRELRDRKIIRIYHTLVRGHLSKGGTINLPIGRHPTLRQKQAVTLKGKPAITHYHILEQLKRHTLLKVKLETGRTHQIRVHMAHLKHPILGDLIYGNHKQDIIVFKRQALHSKVLGLQHPLTHQFCYWQAPLPSDMQQVLTKLREDTE